MSKTLDDYSFKDSSRRPKPKSPKKQEKQTTLDGGIASRSFNSRPEDGKRSRNKYYKPEDDNVGERDLGDAQLAPELELDNAIEQSIRDTLPPTAQTTPRRKLGYARKSSTLAPSPKPSPKPSDVLIVRSTPKKENTIKATKVPATGSPAKKGTPRPVAIVADSSSSDSDIQPVRSSLFFGELLLESGLGTTCEAFYERSIKIYELCKRIAREDRSHERNGYPWSIHLPRSLRI